MPLTIHLDDPLPLYSGSELIRGTVILECPNAIDIDDIRVIFSGRAKAKIQKVKGSAAPSASYTSKCDLFEKERILLHLGGGTLLPQTYEWGFQFEFPSTVSPPASCWPEKLPFRSDANHPLPPTFATKTQDSLRRLDCSIDYQIRAQVSKPQRGVFGKSPFFDEQVRLPFVSAVARLDGRCDSVSPAYRHEEERLFTVRSLLLLPENRGRGLTFQERFQSWIFPGQLPKFDFQATFSYSTRVAQSAPLHCVLSITPLMEYSSVSVTPEILLQSLSISVISRTYARATSSFMGAMSGEVDERIEILSKSSVGMALSSQTNLGQAFGPLVFKKSDVSFSTFNICRSYRLCVSFLLECAGKTMEFSLPDLPIELYDGTPGNSEKSQKGHPGISRQVAGEASPTSGEVGDAPPSYTPASTFSVGSREKRT
ncbi:hypothetical protein FE257_004452 [Aspergillus nanangensis]|uniref:Arrestin-like N-terminal domain-containing protein n=1 Tax=Aspergillus nanangensis TaxID=2582783 RepID=A0AAD4CYJ3_ASPNN|nr:hypothetical protein FE257_004452 [Aspergillus nanangensis]